MEDDESDYTQEVVVEQPKPKKPRSPAQVAALKKGLEALKKKREMLKQAEEKREQVPPPALPPPPPQEVQPAEVKPKRESKKKAAEKKPAEKKMILEVPEYMTKLDLQSITNELKSEIKSLLQFREREEAVELEKPEKPKQKKQPKVAVPLTGHALLDSIFFKK